MGKNKSIRIEFRDCQDGYYNVVKYTDLLNVNKSLNISRCADLYLSIMDEQIKSDKILFNKTLKWGVILSVLIMVLNLSLNDTIIDGLKLAFIFVVFVMSFFFFVLSTLKTSIHDNKLILSKFKENLDRLSIFESGVGYKFRFEGGNEYTTISYIKHFTELFVINDSLMDEMDKPDIKLLRCNILVDIDVLERALENLKLKIYEQKLL